MDEQTLTLPRSRAVAVFVGLGMPAATEWNRKRMLRKIESLPAEVGTDTQLDDDQQNEDLWDMIEALDAGQKVNVIPDADFEELFDPGSLSEDEDGGDPPLVEGDNIEPEGEFGEGPPEEIAKAVDEEVDTEIADQGDPCDSELVDGPNTTNTAIEDEKPKPVEKDSGAQVEKSPGSIIVRVRKESPYYHAGFLWGFYGFEEGLTDSLIEQHKALTEREIDFRCRFDLAEAFHMLRGFFGLKFAVDPPRLQARKTRTFHAGEELSHLATQEALDDEWVQEITSQSIANVSDAYGRDNARETCNVLRRVPSAIAGYVAGQEKQGSKANE